MTNIQMKSIKAGLTLIIINSLSACSYAPGLSVSQNLENSTLSQGVLDSHQSIEYITEAGTKVIASNVTADNIPASNYQQMNYRVLNSLISKTYYSYQLRQGDIVSLNLWSYPEITPTKVAGNARQTGYRIDQQGYVHFPLIGRIKVNGLSINTLQQRLRKAYARYLKNPDLTVRVIEYNANKYYIYGEVNKPGQYRITDLPVNLMTAIGDSGGATKNANLHDIKLTRGTRTYRLSLPDMRKIGIQPTRIILRNNDVLSVGNKQLRKLYLLGETATQKPIIIPEEGMSLSSVIGEGKGLQSKTASASKIYVLRDNYNDKVTNIYRVDLSKVENFTLANQFRMQKNDIVFVDATGLAKWNRIISLMLPSATAIRSTQSITGS